MEVEGLGGLFHPGQLVEDSPRSQKIDRQTRSPGHEEAFHWDDSGCQHQVPLSGVAEPDIEDETGLVTEQIPDAHTYPPFHIGDLEQRVVGVGHRLESNHLCRIRWRWRLLKERRHQGAAIGTGIIVLLR